MFEILWWHWAVLGLLLVLSELALPTFVLIWFGLGGLITGAALFLVPTLGFTAQLALWAAASVGMTALWFRVFRKGDHKSLVGRASAHIEGEVGMITQEVAPFQTGKIRFQKPILGSDLWDCRADCAIPTGTRAKVVSVDGNNVTVAPLSSSPTQGE